MTSIFANTHTMVWYLTKPERLSPAADQALESAVRSGGSIYVSAITLVEVIYLIEKDRLPSLVGQRLDEALDHAGATIAIVPVDRAVAERMRFIAREDVPDMPDRLIAASALRMNVPLVTRDRKIQSAGLQTIR